MMKQEYEADVLKEKQKEEERKAMLHDQHSQMLIFNEVQQKQKKALVAEEKVQDKVMIAELVERE